MEANETTLVGSEVIPSPRGMSRVVGCPCCTASGLDFGGMGGDTCASAVGNGAGVGWGRVGACGEIEGDALRMKLNHGGGVIADYHWENIRSKAPAFVAGGIPICQAKAIPRARAADDSE